MGAIRLGWAILTAVSRTVQFHGRMGPIRLRSQPMALRIKGLVSAAKRVRQQLQVGIPPEQLPQVQDYIRDTLATVEHICQQAWATPDQLPAPSRNAYWYLKNLDLAALPIAAPGVASAPPKTIRLRNIRVRQQDLQRRIAEIVTQPQPAHFYLFRQHLHHCIQTIDDLCDQQQLSPAHLAGTARQVYAWMKFLLLDQHLEAHVQAIQQIRQLVKHMQAAAPKHPDPEHPSAVNPDTLAIEFAPMSVVYRYRYHPNQAHLQINEATIFAEQTVWQALVSTILWGKQKSTHLVINQYTTSEEFSELLLKLEMQVDPTQAQHQGQFFDLETVFEQVNAKYFQGAMARPQLAWSQGFNQRKLGHYEPARDQVVLSLTLDQAQVPPYVVEFVMYHELLHKHHGETWVNGRRMVHTAEFRRDERRFHQYRVAQEWLSQPTGN